MHTPPGQNPGRMSTFAGVESVLKGLLLCLSISSSLGAGFTDIMVVKYPKAVLTKQEGKSLTLECPIIYDHQECQNLDGYWCKSNPKGNCSELKEYLIQVTEKVGNQTTRSRMITMSIEHLTLRDAGTFQCNANCGAEGMRSKGKFIELSVLKADQHPGKNCGVHRVEGAVETDEARASMAHGAAVAENICGFFKGGPLARQPFSCTLHQARTQAGCPRLLE
ncbi:hypothetical protein COCON_G00052080 [Conger conger]|uniref:Ig-like domain-containing protein n=1 Tax=Conger conger TaxID=82655 RepID=A0A9Q1I4W4_CONCO|nr:hypothetical protein COCON_G00052080 [Conger conger]